MLAGVRERAVGLGYSAGWGLVRTMPHVVSAQAFRSAADAAAIRNGRGARQLRENLRRVVGPGMSELRMDALVGDALRSYSRYWLETFRLENMDHEAVTASIDEHAGGTDHLEAGLERGKGVILALPHSGNWEASGLWLVARYGTFSTVAERVRPESLFDRFLAYRQSLGMEVVALTGGDRPPMQVLAQRLRENRVVCLVADRDLSSSGVPVDFFGAPATMPPGPALLAARTGASLHAAHCRFVGPSGWGHWIGPPIDLDDAATGRLRERVAAATQRIADRFAERIAEHPADWHMLQRLWPADSAVPQASHASQLSPSTG